MTIGTRSVLYGAHCFWLHPWFVALGWWKLYGFPWDPRLWVAFFVHDMGYLGKPNMDGEDGERHPELGARIMTALFDQGGDRAREQRWRGGEGTPDLGRWGRFTYYHSRFLAKRWGAHPSRLCFADKLSICLTPWWIYRWTAGLTGEIREYRAQDPAKGCVAGGALSDREWYEAMQRFVRQWINDHIDGREDRVTGVRT